MIHVCPFCTYILLSSVISFICFAGQVAIADNRNIQKAAISIRAATPEEEFGIIWYTLRNMAFFREHGYDVTFPDHKNFAQLSKAPLDTSEVNKKELYELFGRKIYDKSKYEKGLKGVLHAEEIVENAFPIFEKFREKWDFTVHKSYEVILTLYGPGGQYNPKTGKIFLKSTANGQFKRIDPMHTIIHEMVHIGIEKNIVKKYQLTHWEKERVVDLVCSLAFIDLLPNYTLQWKGEKSLDAFVNKDSIMNLPLAIESYVKQKDDAHKESVEIIIVHKVFEGSQAEKIRLQKGDILIEYNGEMITSPDKLKEVVKSTAKKKEVELAVIRENHVKRFVIMGGSIGIKISKNNILKESLPKEYQ